MESNASDPSPRRAVGFREEVAAVEHLAAQRREMERHAKSGANKMFVLRDDGTVDMSGAREKLLEDVEASSSWRRPRPKLMIQVPDNHRTMEELFAKNSTFAVIPNLHNEVLIPLELFEAVQQRQIYFKGQFEEQRRVLESTQAELARTQGDLKHNVQMRTRAEEANHALEQRVSDFAVFNRDLSVKREAAENRADRLAGELADALDTLRKREAELRLSMVRVDSLTRETEKKDEVIRELKARKAQVERNLSAANEKLHASMRINRSMRSRGGSPSHADLTFEIPIDYVVESGKDDDGSDSALAGPDAAEILLKRERQITALRTRIEAMERAMMWMYSRGNADRSLHFQSLSDIASVAAARNDSDLTPPSLSPAATALLAEGLDVARGSFDFASTMKDLSAEGACPFPPGSPFAVIWDSFRDAVLGARNGVHQTFRTFARYEATIEDSLSVKEVAERWARFAPRWKTNCLVLLRSSFEALAATLRDIAKIEAEARETYLREGNKRIDEREAEIARKRAFALTKAVQATVTTTPVGCAAIVSTSTIAVNTAATSAMASAAPATSSVEVQVSMVMVPPVPQPPMSRGGVGGGSRPVSRPQPDAASGLQRSNSSLPSTPYSGSAVTVGGGGASIASPVLPPSRSRQSITQRHQPAAAEYQHAETEPSTPAQSQRPAAASDSADDDGGAATERASAATRRQFRRHTAAAAGAGRANSTIAADSEGSSKGAEWRGRKKTVDARAAAQRQDDAQGEGVDASSRTLRRSRTTSSSKAPATSRSIKKAPSASKLRATAATGKKPQPATSSLLQSASANPERMPRAASAVDLRDYEVIQRMLDDEHGPDFGAPPSTVATTAGVSKRDLIVRILAQRREYEAEIEGLRRENADLAAAAAGPATATQRSPVLTSQNKPMQAAKSPLISNILAGDNRDGDDDDADDALASLTSEDSDNTVESDDGDGDSTEDIGGAPAGVVRSVMQLEAELRRKARVALQRERERRRMRRMRRRKELARQRLQQSPVNRTVGEWSSAADTDRQQEDGKDDDEAEEEDRLLRELQREREERRKRRNEFRVETEAERKARHDRIRQAREQREAAVIERAVAALLAANSLTRPGDGSFRAAEPQVVPVVPAWMENILVTPADLSADSGALFRRLPPLMFEFHRRFAAFLTDIRRRLHVSFPVPESTPFIPGRATQLCDPDDASVADAHWLVQLDLDAMDALVSATSSKGAGDLQRKLASYRDRIEALRLAKLDSTVNDIRSLPMVEREALLKFRAAKAKAEQDALRGTNGSGVIYVNHAAMATSAQQYGVERSLSPHPPAATRSAAEFALPSLIVSRSITPQSEPPRRPVGGAADAIPSSLPSLFQRQQQVAGNVSTWKSVVTARERQRTSPYNPGLVAASDRSSRPPLMSARPLPQQQQQQLSEAPTSRNAALQPFGLGVKSLSVARK